MTVYKYAIKSVFICLSAHDVHFCRVPPFPLFTKSLAFVWTQLGSDFSQMLDEDTHSFPFFPLKLFAFRTH